MTFGSESEIYCWTEPGLRESAGISPPSPSEHPSTPESLLDRPRPPEWLPDRPRHHRDHCPTNLDIT